MEEKINIAEILKDKPEGTKLWTDMFGSVTLYVVTNTCDAFQVKHHNKEPWFDKDGKLYKEGVLCIYPSKTMRDWEKFSWKRGDVLISDCGFVCIFKEWASDDYTRFNGCYFDGMPNAQTAKYRKLDNNTAYGYIRELEKRCGGVLNIKTLKIEKHEFKDGDVLFVKCNDSAFIEIFEYSKKNGDLCDHASLDITNQILDISGKYIIRKDEITELRLATEEEKKQLFSALEKEGKAWDSDKKAIVDLKPKVELKPFDKVLCRNSKDDTWEADFFARLTRKEIDYTQSGKYLCVGDLWMYCIPYNEETAHLLGTTDEWKVGEV